jgi:DNA-binding winged helix-turn-helix (wHTH) protein
MEEIRHPASPIRFGIFELDLQAGELSRQGRRIKLQEQPLQVLVVLLERAGEVVTREQLQKQLWPADTYVDFDRGLNRAINKLREALVDSADSPRFIETLPRRGYRFVAEVTAAHRPEAPALQPLPLNVTSLSREPVQRTGGFGNLADHRKRWALPAVVIVLLAAGGWVVTSWTRWSRPPVIVLMDTSAPMGVYDPTTRKNSGTNADDISDVLRDLPVVLHKEGCRLRVEPGASGTRTDSRPDRHSSHRFFPCDGPGLPGRLSSFQRFTRRPATG